MEVRSGRGEQGKAPGCLRVEFVSTLMTPLCIEFSNEAANTVPGLSLSGKQAGLV